MTAPTKLASCMIYAFWLGLVCLAPQKSNAQSIDSVQPSSACIGDIIRVFGEGLDIVQSARVASETATIVAGSQNSDGFELIVPDGLPFSGNQPTAFNVIGVIPNQPNAVLQDAVTVSPELNLTPAIVDDESNSFCEGTSRGLTVSVSPNDPDYIYSWSPIASLDVSDEQTVLATPLDSTTYLVSVTDGNGCTFVDSIDLFVRSYPEYNSVNIIQAPCGDNLGSVEVFASGDAELELRLRGDGVLIGFQTNPVFTDLPQGPYEVELRYSNSPRCRVDLPDSFILSEDAGTLNAVILAPADGAMLCIGDTLTLLAQEDPSVVEYKWEVQPNGDLTSDEGIGPIEAVFMEDGEKEIILSVLAGECPARDTVTINVSSPPDLVIDKSVERTCEGDSIVFSTDAASDVVYTWDFGNGSPTMASGAGPHAVAFSEAGTQLIRLTGEREMCFDNLEDSVMIDLRPQIIVIPSIPSFVLSGDSLRLVLQAAGEDVMFGWEITQSNGFDTLPALSGEGPVIDGVYSLSSEESAEVEFLVYAFSNGCVDSLRFSFTVSNDPIFESFFWPDVFTPNGDGFNDNWSIQLPDELIASEHRLLIFNRSGGLIFEDDASSTWNGENFRNGRPAPTGPYWYVIHHEDQPNQPIQSGVFTLLR